MAKADIAIIGGGFSGTAAAIHLSRVSPTSLRIHILDPRVPGPGLAHSTPDPDHRLNAPDSIHILYPDDVESFPRWFRETGGLAADAHALAPSGFVYPRRAVFGAYAAEQLVRHSRSNPSASDIEHVPFRATRLRSNRNGMEVQLEDGESLNVTSCILATGWDAPATPAQMANVSSHRAWIADPWNDARTKQIPRNEPVLLLGAGLTASDTFASLVRSGHQAPIICLSRRGLRPASQNPYRSPGSFWNRLTNPEPVFIARHGIPQSPREALRSLRDDIARLDPQGSSWHAPFDEVRDAMGHVWPNLEKKEQLRYARHLKHWYDAHRFRNPPQVEAIIDQGTRSGQLSFLTGRICGATADGVYLNVEYVNRDDHAVRRVKAAAVINCTGPASRPSVSTNPLLRGLVADGIITDSPCRIGVAVNRSCRAISANGEANDRLLVIGPPTSGCLGETTAVPFITRQLVDVLKRDISPVSK